MLQTVSSVSEMCCYQYEPIDSYGKAYGHLLDKLFQRGAEFFK